MEQVPNWLEAAVLAAGLATAYVADDWVHFDVPVDRTNLPPVPPFIAH